MAKHNETGKMGEGIACRYLENKGFDIIERNYRKPWGELDIIAKKRGIIHFIEVKTVSREISSNAKGSVSREKWMFQPEEAVDYHKQKRLRRVIESYIKVSRVTDWRFNIAAVFLDTKNKAARVRFGEDIVL